MTVYRPLIEHVAAARSLDPNLVEAFVLKESSGDRWAWNPEPRYRYLWNVRTQQPFRALTFAEQASEQPPADFPCLAGDRDQEWWGQQASWGLLQVMGAVAREHGFTGRFLTELCDPGVNLTIGCTVLAQLLTWSGGDIRKAAAAYNGGRGGYTTVVPQQYAAVVLGLLATVEAEHR